MEFLNNVWNVKKNFMYLNVIHQKNFVVEIVVIFILKEQKVIIKKIGKGVEAWQDERTKLFNKNGWQVIFFDETQINEETINERLSCVPLTVRIVGYK